MDVFVFCAEFDTIGRRWVKHGECLFLKGHSESYKGVVLYTFDSINQMQEEEISTHLNSFTFYLTPQKSLQKT